MEILDAAEPSRVRVELVFEKPWKARSETLFTIHPEAAGSRVTWSLTGEKTLMIKVMGAFKSMDKLSAPTSRRACCS